MQACLFCGGDASEPNHLVRCCGRQGAREADIESEWQPLLVSGLTPETYATSEAAALSGEELRGSQRRLVLNAIRAAGLDGCTDDELQERLGLDGSSERPRRWELWRLNAIHERRDAEGNVVRRLTRTNRRAVVWVAA